MSGEAATAIPPEFATPGAQFWEIAADGGDLWDEWREGGLVGIGWDHLGDMTGLDKKGFRAKASDALAKGKRGVWQLWHLVQDMKVGDVVLVRAGWSAILGIGVLTGAYHFAPEDKYHYCHRRPVRWLTKDFSFLRLFFCGTRDDNTSYCFLLSRSRFYYHSVINWFHIISEFNLIC